MRDSEVILSGSRGAWLFPTSLSYACRILDAWCLHRLIRFYSRLCRLNLLALYFANITFIQDSATEQNNLRFSLLWILPLRRILVKLAESPFSLAFILSFRTSGNLAALADTSYGTSNALVFFSGARKSSEEKTWLETGLGLWHLFELIF